MSLNKTWCLLFVCELFLMMWATGELIALKIVLCVAICGLGILRNKGRIYICREVLVWVILYIGMNVFSTILSCIYGNAGAFDYINVDIVEPIIFVTLISVVSEKDFQLLKHFPVVISLFLCVYLFIAFLSINAILNVNIVKYMPFVGEDFGGVLPFGLKKADSECIQWLYFLIPGNVILFYFRKELKQPRIKKYIVINFIMSIITVIIVLKTAMILVVMISLILCCILRYYKKDRHCISYGKVLKLFLAISVIIVLWNVLHIGDFLYDTIVKKVLISFDSNMTYTNRYGVVDYGGNVRVTQIKDLLETWKQKPLFGWGVGADALNVVRSDVHGAYEMTYFAKLMQRGVLGFALYIVLIMWMMRKLFKFAKQSIYKFESLYVAVGLIGMLVANGTNPYLESFDKLIILFFPLLIINLSHVKSSGLSEICE